MTALSAFVSKMVDDDGSGADPPFARDQIRDQDATGRNGAGWDGCNVVAVASATNGDEETRHTVWDRVSGAHNPEVAGSNPAPLPTRQRDHRRSTARKLSLRAVFMSGGGVLSDQITDKLVSGVPPRLTLNDMHRDA